MWVLFDALLSVGVLIERALRLTRLLDTGVGGLEKQWRACCVRWLLVVVRLGWVCGLECCMCMFDRCLRACEARTTELFR